MLTHPTTTPQQASEEAQQVSEEMRAWARVIKAALGICLQYWRVGAKLPEAHPYRQAALMFVRFLERRYGV